MSITFGQSADKLSEWCQGTNVYSKNQLGAYGVVFHRSTIFPKFLSDGGCLWTYDNHYNVNDNHIPYFLVEENQG